MVTRIQFQLTAILCLSLIVVTSILAVTTKPRLEDPYVDRLSFDPDILSFANDSEAVSTDFAQTHFFQGTPVKKTVVKKESKEKAEAIKVAIPSKKLNVVGVLIDTDQPENARVMLDQPESGTWLGLGDSLPGEFKQWKIQTIELESVSVVFESHRDRLTRLKK